MQTCSIGFKVLQFCICRFREFITRNATKKITSILLNLSNFLGKSERVWTLSWKWTHIALKKRLSFSWTLPYGQIWLHFQTNLQRRNSDCLLEKMFLKYFIPDELYNCTCEIALAQSKATAPKYKNKGSPYAYHATKAFTRSSKGRAKKMEIFHDICH